MDQPFFYGSQTCGMCIAMHGTGPGSGRKSSVRLALATFELYNVAETFYVLPPSYGAVCKLARHNERCSSMTGRQRAAESCGTIVQQQVGRGDEG